MTTTMIESNRENTLKILYSLRGRHDQTARCEAIKAIVDYHYGSSRDKDQTITEAFVELLIQDLDG